MTSTSLTPRTDRSSYSFYVDAGKPDAISRSAELADAVVVRGATGPRTVSDMRHGGWSGSVLFDRAAYEKPEALVEPQPWFEAQVQAGADRIMSPGRWIRWDQDPRHLDRELSKEFRVADQFTMGSAATVLVSIDHRWLTRGVEATATAFGQADKPIAVALANPGDPLSIGNAVDGLIQICKGTKHFTVLRTDHGGIGALAFDATHASLGLRSGNRHVVPPGSSSGGKRNDRTPRVFVKDLFDWFTGFTIAGWAASDINLNCRAACCGGAPLSRFLDERLVGEAEYHNMLTTSELAMYVINAPPSGRRRLFADLCSQAIRRYDSLGSMAIGPKAQLEAWALWA